MNVLLVVSHPDDDAIFAGALQRMLGGQSWRVVCVTSDADQPRGRELVGWQTRLGTPRDRIRFLGERDDPEDLRRRRCSLDTERIAAALRDHGPQPDLVVTHNARGEYGHPHHVATHRAATRAFPAAARLEFGYGEPHPDLALPCAAKWSLVSACFPSQRQVIARFERPQETFCWHPPRV